AQTIFFWTEVEATLVHVGLAWHFVSKLGTTGAGMEFFGLYVWNSIHIYVIVRRLTGLRGSAANRRHVLIFLPASVLVFS
ncbi:O-antigen translocase, partial [Rhizobium johnstonii]